MLHEITLCISIEKKIIEERWQSKERRWSGSSPQSVVGLSKVQGNKEHFLWAKWTVKKVHWILLPVAHSRGWAMRSRGLASRGCGMLCQGSGLWRIGGCRAGARSPTSENCAVWTGLQLPQRTFSCLPKEQRWVLNHSRPLVLIHNKHICSRTQHRENHNGDKPAAKQDPDFLPYLFTLPTCQPSRVKPSGGGRRREAKPRTHFHLLWGRGVGEK